MTIRRTIWVLVLLGVTTMFTGCTGLWRDANEYARQFEVSQGEAIQRLRYQDAIGELAAALEENEADTFGGLWIQHEPDYRIVVRFTHNGEDTIRPYIEGEPYAHLIDVRGAEYTLAELRTTLDQTSQELEKLDFGVAVSLSVQDNRVEVPVTDRAWFESELRKAGAVLPEGVELVVIQGGSTARNKDLLLTPPVPGIAFPRQKPVEGFRESMLAELIGTLQLEGECLYVDSLLGGERVLPIWPPEFTLRIEGEQLLVIDGQGQVAARAGEEVYMGGGHVPVTDEWVLQQIPSACQGSYFVVGEGVRPNLRQETELLYTDVISTAGGTILFPRYKAALDEQVTDAQSIAGQLVAYDYQRCLHLQTESWGPFTLLWPTDWSLQVTEDTATVVDGRGKSVAQPRDEVSLRARSVPHTADSPVYRQLIEELPGECIGATWLVDSIE